MVNKVLMIIMDGLGDRPIKEFEDKTPLEKASTPNFNKIVQKSQCGLMSSLGKFIRPGSDTAHLAILGYDINKYYDSYVLASVFPETTVYEEIDKLVIRTSKENFLCDYDYFDSAKINITIDDNFYQYYGQQHLNEKTKADT